MKFIMYYLAGFFLHFFLSFTCFAQAAGDYNQQLDAIRFKVTAIGHMAEGTNFAAEFDQIIADSEQLIALNPNRAEAYIWKAICLAAQAKHKGLSALSNVKEAKKLLEKAISIDPNAVEGAAYNTLGILYYKVPGWPIGFGDDALAESNFKKALSISSNLDTNFRYGEFLLDQGKKAEALIYLQKALAFPDRANRQEDPLKKKEIEMVIEKNGLTKMMEIKK